MKYILPEHVEMLVQKVAAKLDKSEDEVRAEVMLVMKKHGYAIGIPLELELREVSVRAGEQAVIENLRKIEQGLPHASHKELTQNITHAQMRAREAAVVRRTAKMRSHLRLVKR